MKQPKAKTIGELKASGYTPKTIKQEIRDNLVARMKAKQPMFEGILGYDQTVIPDVQRSILSRHNMILLGLRGQAKTRIARLMVDLLDEWVPVLEGSELNEDPLLPITKQSIEKIAELGDKTPITWLHRSDRYAEKLATPDVSVADLIGDVDPIKAANMRLSYADERVIHFGLVPRSNRCIFVINELPDLQARIQVSLFNILQEGDVQIRGFKLRLPLDIQFVFTANPEDYTNRGSIVTPLKDRIESQILTHYPKDIAISKSITLQEAELTAEQKATVGYSDLALTLNEQIAVEARSSEFVDAKSGVSARLTISAFENLFSAAERRSIINGEDKTYVRMGDFWGIIPAITGKIELVYEGEQEGPYIVAQNLLSKSIRTLFAEYFPNPEKLRKKKDANPYQVIVDWFNLNTLDILNEVKDKDYAHRLLAVDGLDDLVKKYHPEVKGPEKLFYMEFVLHGLAEFSQLNKHQLETGVRFKDLLGAMFDMSGGEN